MFKLTREYDALSPWTQKLVRIFYDLHPLVNKSMEDMEDLVKGLEKLDLQDREARLARSDIHSWLDRVLYAICRFVPSVDEKTAFNFALGHDVALWLFDHGQTVKAACCAYRYLSEENDKLPTSVIRLPGSVTIFERAVFPHIEEIHKNTLTDWSKQF